MVFKKLLLTNFRSYTEREFLFSPRSTLVVGPNTSGKTNLLEAVYLLSTGKSLRAGLESEMIRWGGDWARVEGWLSADNTDREEDNADLGIDFSVSEEIEGNGGGKKLEFFIEANKDNHSYKQFKVNGVKKDLGSFQGSFSVVIFAPESLQLILGSPSYRRGYLDRVLSSFDPSYFRVLEEYRKVVKNRNRLLWEIRERGTSRGRLDFWDERLFTLGEEIFGTRKELISDLNQKLLNLKLDIGLSYSPSVLDRGLYEERLPEEIEKATTLWGPHRDDFRFSRVAKGEDSVVRESQGVASKNIDLSTFGSRGEQREAVFALCLSELEVVSEGTGERPILLLDDIFSELDEAHRRRVLEVLPKQQTIITSAEPELLNSGLKYEAKVIDLGAHEL